MDARPLRPMRSVRVQADENTAPPAQSKQAIHQRHKSTGTLSNMLAGGGLKAAAKRTAFGDVSNTVKGVGTARDDSVVNGKQINLDYIKPIVAQDKPGAFLRPAQRPINNGTAKIVQNSLATIVADSIPEALPSKLDVKQQAPGLKRTQSKKLPAIFKDENAQEVGQEVQSEIQLARPESATLPPVRQHLGPRQQPSQAKLSSTQLTTTSVRPTTTTNRGANEPVDNSIPVVLSSENVPEVLPALLQEEPLAVEVEARETIPLVKNDEYESYMKSIMPAESQSWAKAEEEDKVHVQQRQLPAVPRASEPEEYWDDEEEEVYDEQGYTTAHSYRSRGDNTTGGVTTVMFPKVTNKIKQELAAAKVLVESQRSQEEIEDEAWDTSMVAEYGDEIFAYMRELEIKMLPNAHYMDLQTEIQWSMRSVLMDWLIQVHHRFSLLPETLFLCVNYIDRFLSCKIVSLGKLQLVGATAIFVAAKYEEINCPSVNEIVYMVDGGYTVDEILKAERFMLSMLQFELGWPGPMSFLRRISKADDYDLETRTLAKYFLEVTIMDERFVGSPPSYIAAGAHCFARFILRKGDWSAAHAYYSGYTWTQLRPLVAMILECCENPQKHHGAVFEKYQDRRFKKASSFTQQELSKGFSLPPMFHSRPSLPSMEDIAAQYSTQDSYKRMVQLKN